MCAACVLAWGCVWGACKLCLLHPSTSSIPCKATGLLKVIRLYNGSMFHESNRTATEKAQSTSIPTLHTALLTTGLFQTCNLHIWWHRPVRHPPAVTKTGLPNEVVSYTLNTTKVTSARARFQGSVGVSTATWANFQVENQKKRKYQDDRLKSLDITLSKIKQPCDCFCLWGLTDLQTSEIAVICRPDCFATSPGFSLLLASSCTSSALLKRDCSPGCIPHAQRKLPKMCSKSGLSMRSTSFAGSMRGSFTCTALSKGFLGCERWEFALANLSGTLVCKTSLLFGSCANITIDHKESATKQR